MYRGAWQATVHRIARVGHNWATNIFTFVFNKDLLYNRGDSTQYSVMLPVPWTARSNQSVLKEINPECSLAGLILKLKLRYFGLLMRRADLLEKTLMLGKTEARGEGGDKDEMVGWHHWLNGHEFEQTTGDSEGQGSLRASVQGDAELDTTWATEQQQLYNELQGKESKREWIYVYV